MTVVVYLFDVFYDFAILLGTFHFKFSFEFLLFYAPDAIYHTLSTIHHSPYIMHFKLYTIHYTPYTIHLTSFHRTSLNHKSYTNRHKQCTIHYKHSLYTIHHIPYSVITYAITPNTKHLKHFAFVTPYFVTLFSIHFLCFKFPPFCMFLIIHDLRIIKNVQCL